MGELSDERTGEIYNISKQIEFNKLKFINSENSKTSKPNVLILKVADKLDLKRGEKVLLYQILVFTILGKT